MAEDQRFSPRLRYCRCNRSRRTPGRRVHLRETVVDHRYRSDQIIVSFAEPDNDLRSFLVNLTHKQNLLVALWDILLVDTQGINPDDPKPGLIAQASKSICQIVCERDIDAGAYGGELACTGSPDIGECFEFWSVIQ